MRINYRRSLSIRSAAPADEDTRHDTEQRKGGRHGGIGLYQKQKYAPSVIAGGDNPLLLFMEELARASEVLSGEERRTGTYR